MNIRRCTFMRALGLVHKSGVHRRLDVLLRPEGSGGRPRVLDVDVFLAALIVTVGSNAPLTMVSVHRTLTERLPRSLQTHLGLRSGQDVVTIRQVRYLLDTIAQRLAHTPGYAPNLGPVEQAERRELLQLVVDDLISATVPAHLRHHGEYAIDATALESAARGKRRKRATADQSDDGDGRARDDLADVTDLGTVAHDRDAAWMYRTKTYENKSTSCFGYQVIALTRVPLVGQMGSEPLLVERLRVVPGNHSVIEPSMDMFEAQERDRRPVTHVVADRGFSYALPERWAYRLRELRISQTIDLHANDYGPRDFDGLLMLAGVPHCPSTPEHLWDIRPPRPLKVGVLRKNATATEQAAHQQQVERIGTFAALIAERDTYAFVRHNTGRTSGKERWKCPARAGKIACAGCPIAALMPEGTPQVENPPPPETAPRGCTQATITVPWDVSPKLRQRWTHGSPEWIADWSRRPLVEGHFGNLKNPYTENVNRGWIAVVGLVKTTLLAAIAIVATNLRLLRRWAENTGDVTDPLCHPDPTDHGFEELTDLQADAERPGGQPPGHDPGRRNPGGG